MAECWKSCLHRCDGLFLGWSPGCRDFLDLLRIVSPITGNNANVCEMRVTIPTPEVVWVSPWCEWPVTASFAFCTIFDMIVVTTNRLLIQEAKVKVLEITREK